MELNEKQRHIMLKALEIFAEKGSDAASVRDIAQHAGVNVAMISYYFGSKEKLLETIFKYRAEYLTIKIENIIHSKSNAIEKLDLLIDTYLNLIVGNRNFHQLMMREQVMFRKGALYAYIRDMKLTNRELMKKVIAEGQKENIFRSDVDITMLAVTLFGIINQVFSHYPFICEEYRLAKTDEESLNPIVIDKLRTHLKSIFHTFLSVPHPTSSLKNESNKNEI